MKSPLLFLTYCFAMICLLAPAYGQDDAEEAEPVEVAVEESEAPGDVLVLKSGSRISGFQIIRTTHKHYILEGWYDPDTDETLEIKVPRGQVVEVIRDDIDPKEERAKLKKKALARQRTTVQGARLSDTLYGLLEKVIGDPPLDTAGLTLAQVLEEVSKRADGALKIALAVRNSPRKWKGKIEVTTTLAMFLDNQIAPNYPGLAVLFNENEVVIRQKGPAAAGGRGGAAAAGGGTLAGRGGKQPGGGGAE